MNKKVLQQLCTNLMPRLASYYMDAQMTVFGVKRYVVKRSWNSFASCETKLRHYRIDSRDYADTVTGILQDWVKQKDLECVPIPVFCGTWAFNRYMKVHNSQSIIIKTDTHDDEILQSELLVGRMFIGMNRANPTRMSDVVNLVRPVLSPKWLTIYYQDKEERKRYTDRAVAMIAEEMGVQSVESYRDIVSALL